nr:MAG TPA: hypothetical protein [Caudoviricetes sp.]
MVFCRWSYRVYHDDLKTISVVADISRGYR